MIAAVETIGRNGGQPANGAAKQRQRVPDHLIEIRLVIDLRGSEGSVQRRLFAEPATAVDSELCFSGTMDSYDEPTNDQASGGCQPSEDVSNGCSHDDAGQSLSDLYEQHLAPGERLRNEPKTVRGDIKRIIAFSQWLTDTRITTPRVGQAATLASVAADRLVLRDYARHLRSRDSGASSATAMLSLSAIMKLCRWAVDAGLLSRLPKCPTRGDVNLMRPAFTITTTSSDPAQESDSDFCGEPVSVDEMRRMLSQDVLAPCAWPCLGAVPPAVFWEIVLLAHAVLGFRSQDWFALRDPLKQGLLWSGVLSEAQCPRVEGLMNSGGWAWYLVHKTKKKSQRADKPQQLLVPLPSRLQALIELFRGLDPVRVFPIPQNTHSWSREFHGILQRAGVDDQTRQKARKPVIRLSEGKRAIASFRKGCATMWADHVSEAAASYLLKHSVSDDKVSITTRAHYLQAYRPLKAIVAAIESLPILS